MAWGMSETRRVNEEVERAREEDYAEEKRRDLEQINKARSRMFRRWFGLRSKKKVETPKGVLATGELRVPKHLRDCFGPDESEHVEAVCVALGVRVPQYVGITLELVLRFMMQIKKEHSVLNVMLLGQNDAGVIMEIIGKAPDAPCIIMKEFIGGVFRERERLNLDNMKKLIVVAGGVLNMERGADAKVVLEMLYHAWAGIFFRDVIEHAVSFVRTPDIFRWSQRLALSILHMAHNYRQQWTRNVWERDEAVSPWFFNRLTDIVSGIETALPRTEHWSE